MENILACVQHGSKNYYLIWNNPSYDKKIEITNIEVEALNNNVSLMAILPFNNVINSSGNVYDFYIKVINSGVIKCNAEALTLKLNITFMVDGETYYETITTNKGGSKIIYNSNDFTERKYSPTVLKLDSFYRPFFVNSVLLLLPDNFLNSSNNESNSKKCCARLYYSIANGCSYRIDDISPVYKMGDIDINLQHSENYTLKIRDSYRVFNEMDEPPKGGAILEQHIRGIREAGYDNVSHIEDAGGFNIKSGINLSKSSNGNIIYPFNVYDDNDFIKRVVYKKDDGSFINMSYVDGDSQNEDLYYIDTTEPLIFNMTIKDYAPIGYESNEIKLSTSPIYFPDKITKIDGDISFSSAYNINDIAYLYTGTNDEPHTLLQKIVEKLGDINVNDGFVSSDKIPNGNITQTIYDLLKCKANGTCDDPVLLVDFKLNSEGTKYISTINKQAKYLLAIYTGNMIKSDDNPFSYIQHTNKLLVIKVYKL